MPVGEALRYWRSKRGVSLEDLADRLTIAPDCLEEVEKGQRKMAMAAWQEASTYLQVPVEELMAEAPPGDGVGTGKGEATPPEGLYCENGGGNHRVRLQVGTTIRTLREKKGLSVTDLARASGLSPAHISEIERGRTSPSIRTLEKLAQVLDVQTSELVRAVGASGVGAKLKRLRERLGLSQKELAERAGVSYGLIGQIESGRTQSSVTTLSLLANALGVSPCYFLMDEEEVLDLTRSLSPEVAELLSSPPVREVLVRVAGLSKDDFAIILEIVDAVVSRLVHRPAPTDPRLRELQEAMAHLSPEDQRFLIQSAQLLAARKSVS